MMCRLQDCTVWSYLLFERICHPNLNNRVSACFEDADGELGAEVKDDRESVEIESIVDGSHAGTWKLEHRDIRTPSDV